MFFNDTDIDFKDKIQIKKDSESPNPFIMYSINQVMTEHPG